MLDRTIRGHLAAMDDNLKKIIIIALLVKFAIFFVIIIAYFTFPFNMSVYSSVLVSLPRETVNLFTAFKTWDGSYYLFLAENGYPHGVTTSAAFFPLYPFLIRSVGFLLLGNTLAAGLLISSLCSLLATVYFYLFVKKLYSAPAAFTACLYMIAFLTFFYTSLVYTEGLFLLLVIAFFYYLYEKKFSPCLILGILIPLTRPTGILVIVPLLAYLVLDVRNAGKANVTKNSLLLLGFIAGFMLYLGIMNFFTGSFFSGFEAQTPFISHNSLDNLLQPLVWFQKNFLTVRYTLNGYTTSILNRVFFGLFLVLLWFIYRYTDTTLFVYSLAMGMVPALSDSFVSYIRYLCVIFPIFIVLSLKWQKRPWVIIIPMAVLQIVLLTAHALNYWVA